MAVSKKLKIEAQNLMDLYYQDFATADEFFNIDDIAAWVGKAYGKIADDVARDIYKASISEQGTGLLIFSQDWWAKKEFDVKPEMDGTLKAEIDCNYLGFTYDSQNSGIQEVVPAGNSGNCGTYIRTTLTELWIVKKMSMSSVVHWYPDMDTTCNKLNLKFFVKSDCRPKKVAVYYIPSAEDENFKVPTSKAMDIATMAFNLMIAAKNATPITDTTNDMNTNKVPQTELDLNALKQPGK